MHKRASVRQKLVSSALHTGRQLLNTVDKTLRNYGDAIGRVATSAAPLASVFGGPMAGVAVGALGEFARSYSDVSKMLA